METAKPTYIDANGAHPATKYKSAFLLFGIIQMLASFLCIGIGIYGGVYGYQMWRNRDDFYMEQRPDNYELGPGNSYYGPNPREYAFIAMACVSGVLFFVSGLLGIISGRNPTNCNVIGGLVMTIFSCLSAFNLIFYQVIPMFFKRYEYIGAFSPFYVRIDSLHVTLMVIGGIIFIVSIVHSAFSCATTCCAKPVMSMVLNEEPPQYQYQNYNYQDDHVKKKLLEV